MQEALGGGGGLHRSAGRGLHGAVRYLLHCLRKKSGSGQRVAQMSVVQLIPPPPHQTTRFGIMLHPLVQLVLRPEIPSHCCGEGTLETCPLVGSRSVLAPETAQ